MIGWLGALCALTLLTALPAQADQMDIRLDEMFARLAAERM